MGGPGPAPAHRQLRLRAHPGGRAEGVRRVGRRRQPRGRRPQPDPVRRRSPRDAAGRRDPVRLGPGPRARERRRAPGRQARQRDADPGRHGQGHRLRSGAGPRGRGRGAVRQPGRSGPRLLLARAGTVAVRAHLGHGRVVVGGHRVRDAPGQAAGAGRDHCGCRLRGIRPVPDAGRDRAGAGRGGGRTAGVLRGGSRRTPLPARPARRASGRGAPARGRPLSPPGPVRSHPARRQPVQPRAVHAGPRPPRQRRGTVDPRPAGGSPPPARPLQPRTASLANGCDHRRRPGGRAGIRAVRRPRERHVPARAGAPRAGRRACRGRTAAGRVRTDARRPADHRRPRLGAGRARPGPVRAARGTRRLDQCPRPDAGRHDRRLGGRFRRAADLGPGRGRVPPGTAPGELQSLGSRGPRRRTPPGRRRGHPARVGARPRGRHRVRTLRPPRLGTRGRADGGPAARGHQWVRRRDRHLGPGDRRTGGGPAVREQGRSPGRSGHPVLRRRPHTPDQLGVRRPHGRPGPPVRPHLSERAVHRRRPSRRGHRRERPRPTGRPPVR